MRVGWGHAHRVGLAVLGTKPVAVCGEPLAELCSGRDQPTPGHPLVLPCPGDTPLSPRPRAPLTVLPGRAGCSRPRAPRGGGTRCQWADRRRSPRPDPSPVAPASGGDSRGHRGVTSVGISSWREQLPPASRSRVVPSEPPPASAPAVPGAKAPRGPIAWGGG